MVLNTHYFHLSGCVVNENCERNTVQTIMTRLLKFRNESSISNQQLSCFSHQDIQKTQDKIDLQPKFKERITVDTKIK